VTDVAVLGAGIVGCTAAALLAEAGADVTVVERERVGAGASGRNSGVLQHPLDPRLADLHHRTVTLHREVLELPDEPDGILLLGETSPAGLPAALEAEVLADASAAEPVLRPGIPAGRRRPAGHRRRRAARGGADARGDRRVDPRDHAAVGRDRPRPDPARAPAHPRGVWRQEHR
jgi:glycine/D-amino acid oxidase-like deaminating enzyme